MKKIPLKMRLLVGLLLVAGFATFTYANNVPKVTLQTSAIFDSVCSQQTGYAIDQAWRNELNARQVDLQKKWDTEGVNLLKTTTKIIGKPFPASNYVVTLSICSIPSMSMPLLVNMRYSLNSFTKNAISEDVSISIVYHELLHLYLNNLIPKNSALLEKYADEPQTVKDHLHLFSLMKAVYLKLGMQNQLNEIIKKDNSLPNPTYKRTWEIINTQDSYQSFLDEIINSK